MYTYPSSSRRRRGPRRSFVPGRGISLALILFVLITLIAGAVWWFGFRSDNPSGESSTSQEQDSKRYLNLSGNYVFEIPDSYSIEDQVPGVTAMVLAYPNGLSVGTLEEAYDAGAISLQYLNSLTDQKPETFKNYINKTMVPDIKKNLSSEVEVEFETKNGRDIANIIVMKDGKLFRSIFARNGKLPVAVQSNKTTGGFNTITQTLEDADQSNLKSEIAPLKQALLDTVDRIKNNKAKELYDQSTSDLKSKNTQEELAGALETSASYRQEVVVINGATYTDQDTFSVTMHFQPQNGSAGQAPMNASLIMFKENGKWKLHGLNLPDPNAS